MFRDSVRMGSKLEKEVNNDLFFVFTILQNLTGIIKLHFGIINTINIDKNIGEYHPRFWINFNMTRKYIFTCFVKKKNFFCTINWLLLRGYNFYFMKLFVLKWYPIILAFICMLYSITLGIMGRQDEALYSAHWPGTILLFAIAIRQRRKPWV